MYLVMFNIDEFMLSTGVSLFSDLDKAVAFAKGKLKEVGVDVDALFAEDTDGENTDTHKFYMGDDVLMTFDTDKVIGFSYVTERGNHNIEVRKVEPDTGEVWELGDDNE